MHSAGPFRPPIELDRFAAVPRAASGFAAGLACGLVVAAIVAQAWLARHLEPLTAWMFADVEVRNLSKLALSPWWRWGVPAATTAALAALAARRVRRPLPYAVLAAAAALALALTYVWATEPFTALAGDGRPD